MPYIVLGIAVAVGLFLVIKGLRNTNPRNLGRMVAMVATLAGTAVLVFLSATGRLGPIGWASLLLPLFLRWRHVQRMLKNMRGPTPGANSDVETAYLRMTLEHDSGVLRGTVIAGKHEGRNLDELGLDELLDLLRECRVNDPRSATVLESYLDRIHGPSWRGGADGGEDGAVPPPGGSSMTREQAYEVLGLRPGATADEVREAHRKLLRANHPDRGGSTYLAAQINMAKDVLLSGS